MKQLKNFLRMRQREPTTFYIIVVGIIIVSLMIVDLVI